MNAGSGSSSSANSSTTTSSSGSGSSARCAGSVPAARCARPVLAHVAPGCPPGPAAPGGAVARRCSAARMRSTSARSSARLVTTPATCGSLPRLAKLAPPLKSTSTNASASGECVSGQAAHERAQQLALAGAGGADQQPVRAHAGERRFLQIEQHGAHLRVDTDRHAQERLGVDGVPRRSVAAVSPPIEPSMPEQRRAARGSRAACRGGRGRQQVGRAGRGGTRRGDEGHERTLVGRPDASRPNAAAAGRQRERRHPNRIAGRGAPTDTTPPCTSTGSLRPATT